MTEYGDPSYDEIDALIDTDPIELGRRLRAANRAIEAVRELHVDGGYGMCRECDSGYEGGVVEWPCPTIEALDALDADG